tara:strand:- start:162 stop:557 length:396 start_codon:yes stop_codon:yes gene_type:complete
MKLQTFKTDGINYNIKSIIWDITKDDLNKIQFFKNMFEFTNDIDEVLLLNNVNDTEFKLLIDYINFKKNNELELNNFVSNQSKLFEFVRELKLDNNSLLYFIKICDYFLIHDLLDILIKEYFNRLQNNKFN